MNITTSQTSKEKVLIISNICGKFNDLLQLYTTITSKSNSTFDIMILIGNVFSQNESFSQLNILTNIPSNILIFDSSSICSVLKCKIKYTPYQYKPNITIFGRSGIYTVPSKSKLQFVYLIGYENTFFLNESNTYHYTGDAFSYDDIYNIYNTSSSSLSSQHKVDFVVLSALPQIISQELQNDFSSPFHNESIHISKKDITTTKVSYFANTLIYKYNPRYIITSVDDFYYERKPFINSKRYLSRYINLAYYQNKTNTHEKYIYALNTQAVSSLTENELKDIDNLDNTLYTLSPFDNTNITTIPLSIADIIQIRNKYNCQNIKVIKDELYIYNIDKYSSYDDVYEYMSTFGKVLKLEMIYHKHKFTGNAFIKFADIKLHNTLLQRDNYYTFKGRKVRIKERIERIKTAEDIAKTCWFCYNNPSIEKELILKTFDNFYIAYPKGPIDNIHFLVLPKKHIQSYTEMDTQMKNEYHDILTTLIQFIEIQNLSYFIYEKNLPYQNESQRHMCVNVIAVDREVMFQYADEGANALTMKKLKYIETYDERYLDMINKDEYYYYINGSTGVKIGLKQKRRILYIKVNKYECDYVDYCRWLICYLIEKEDKLNWKNAIYDVNVITEIKKQINKFYI